MIKRIKLKLALLGCLLFLFQISQKVYAFDEYFDQYSGNISWRDEKVRLDNFAIELRRNPEYRGYIAFYVGEGDSYKRVNSRIDRARKYLVNHRKISAKVIFVIYAGRQKYTSIILQPVSKHEPAPKFGGDKQIE